MPLDSIFIKEPANTILKISMLPFRDKLVVITGVSAPARALWHSIPFMPRGSAAGMESFRLMRQFRAHGKSPMSITLSGCGLAISIDQKGTSRIRALRWDYEIYDYLRLFARTGHPHCPECGREITVQTVEQTDAVKSLPADSRIMILFRW